MAAAPAGQVPAARIPRADSPAAAVSAVLAAVQECAVAVAAAALAVAVGVASAEDEWYNFFLILPLVFLYSYKLTHIILLVFYAIIY